SSRRSGASPVTSPNGLSDLFSGSPDVPAMLQSYGAFAETGPSRVPEEFSRPADRIGPMPVPGPSLLVRVTEAPLDPAEAVEFVAAPGAGGTVLFSGTVRDHSDAGAVTGLEYEAWEERAEQSLHEIG